MFSALANNTGDYFCNATSYVTFYQSMMSTTAIVLVQGKVNVNMYICVIILDTDMIIFDPKLMIILMIIKS